MKQKIRYQIFSILTVAILIMAIFGIFRTVNTVTNQSFDDLVSVAELIEDYGIEKIAGDPDYRNISGEIRITWIAGDGAVLYDNARDKEVLENHRDRPEVVDAFNTGSGESIRNSTSLDQNTYYYAVLLDDNTILRVSKDYDDINTMIGNTVYFTLALTLLMILASYFLAERISRMLVRPLKDMAENIEDIENNQDVYEEIRPFVTTIRQQHLDLLKASRMRQDFTANVTHELKTPLTVISGYSELMSKGYVDASDTRRLAAEIHSNAGKLQALIEDILQLSKMDQQGLEFEEHNTNLELISKNVVENLKIVASRKNVELIYEGSPVFMNVNAKLIEEMLENLVLNAINYNIENGKVYIRLSKKRNSVMIEVQDTGIGIAEKDQKRIFERFYRVDKSRSREMGGTGLGLAIVKHIAAMYNGEITVDSKVGEGTTFTIVF